MTSHPAWCSRHLRELVEIVGEQGTYREVHRGTVLAGAQPVEIEQIDDARPRLHIYPPRDNELTPAEAQSLHRALEVALNLINQEATDEPLHT